MAEDSTQQSTCPAEPVQRAIRRASLSGFPGVSSRRDPLDLLLDHQLFALQRGDLQIVCPRMLLLFLDPGLQRFMLLTELIEMGRHAHERPPASAITKPVNNHLPWLSRWFWPAPPFGSRPRSGKSGRCGRRSRNQERAA